MKEELKIGDYWGKGKYCKKILDIKKLSNGWVIIKTENSKSEKDFKVKVIFSLNPPRSITPKHAHFLIDFYGKLCANKTKALDVLKAINEMWHSNSEIKKILEKYETKITGLPGYSL